MMFKNILFVSCWLVSWGLAYQLGMSRAEIRYIEKKVEVVRYETKEVCRIMAEPSLGDDDISKLFADGKL